MKTCKAIRIIKESRRTHIEWADFFRKNPKCQYELQYAEIGNLKHHEECIERYNEAIKEIEKLLENQK